MVADKSVEMQLQSFNGRCQNFTDKVGRLVPDTPVSISKKFHIALLSLMVVFRWQKKRAAGRYMKLKSHDIKCQPSARPTVFRKGGKKKKKKKMRHEKYKDVSWKLTRRLLSFKSLRQLQDGRSEDYTYEISSTGKLPRCGAETGKRQNENLPMLKSTILL